MNILYSAGPVTNCLHNREPDVTSSSYDSARQTGISMQQQRCRPAAADAQSTFVRVTGTVTDQSGGVLPGVVITITSLSTDITRSALNRCLGPRCALSFH
jgi:hypothetical protein